MTVWLDAILSLPFRVLGSKGPTMFGIACWTGWKLRRSVAKKGTVNTQ